MATMSLARIMYGTSKEPHNSRSVSAPASWTFTAQMTNGGSSNMGAAALASLGALLHKVWAALAHKR